MSHKNTNRLVKLTDEILNCDFTLYVSSREDFEKWLDKNNKRLETKSHITTVAQALDFSDGIVLWLSKYKPNNIDDVAALTHECAHAVQFVCEDRNISDRELFCYYLEWLVREFLTKLNKRSKRCSATKT